MQSNRIDLTQSDEDIDPDIDASECESARSESPPRTDTLCGDPACVTCSSVGYQFIDVLIYYPRALKVTLVTNFPSCLPLNSELSLGLRILPYVGVACCLLVGPTTRPSYSIVMRLSCTGRMLSQSRKVGNYTAVYIGIGCAYHSMNLSQSLMGHC